MFHVRLTFSYSNLHDRSNFILEIPEVGVQLPEWLVTLHLNVRQYVRMQGNGCTRNHLTIG